MSGEAVIDASLFMAMNSTDDRIRRAGKRFFVERLDTGAVMSLEQVGRCDAVIWGNHSRAEQDAYYPFMDNLHTDMKIDRVGYDEQDLRLALTSSLLADLPLTRRLTVAFALNRGGTLFTVDPLLVDRTDLPLGPLPDGDEVPFPEPLERMYRESLALLVKPEDV
ncbi:DUF6190 family protein [Umezawaea sp. NPDC059074]|uniref:DUF6190 family protein n=1 Tax=Umezawaea sp. NPDC059074 TaxID=3346716 RepID=UPI0036C9482B